MCSLTDGAKINFEMERKQKVRIEFNSGLLPRLNPERPVLLDVTSFLVGWHGHSSWLKKARPNRVLAATNKHVMSIVNVERLPC